MYFSIENLNQSPTFCQIHGQHFCSVVLGRLFVIAVVVRFAGAGSEVSKIDVDVGNFDVEAVAPIVPSPAATFVVALFVSFPTAASGFSSSTRAASWLSASLAPARLAFAQTLEIFEFWQKRISS